MHIIIIFLIAYSIFLLYIAVNKARRNKFLEEELHHISISFYTARNFIYSKKLQNEWAKYINEIGYDVSKKYGEIKVDE